MTRKRMLVAMFSSVALATATSGAGIAIASTSHDGVIGTAQHSGAAWAPASGAKDSNASRGAATSPTSVTRTQATAAVLAKVPGTVTHAQSAKRGGFKAFAVTVRVADGSTVTGFVDKASGVIFDWTQTAAPVAVTSSRPANSHSGSTSSTQTDDEQYESDENDDDQYETDENDDDQYESDHEDNDDQGSNSDSDD